MNALTDRLDRSETTVWLEHTDYAARLLNHGVVPWLQPAEFVSLQRRAQGLLKSDVLALDLAPACAAWLTAQAPLRTAMAAKPRALFALKTLLADAALRTHLAELVRGLRASLPATILALALPSPRAWIGIAYAQAHAGAEVEIGTDDADDASMYLADFLRAFADAGIDALLLQEASSQALLGADEVAAYRAVLNVAANYRWAAGLRADRAVAADSLDFVIAPQAPGAKHHGVELGAEFWSGAAQVLATPLRYAAIPAGANPETVLARVAALR